MLQAVRWAARARGVRLRDVSLLLGGAASARTAGLDLRAISRCCAGAFVRPEMASAMSCRGVLLPDLH